MKFPPKHPHGACLAPTHTARQMRFCIYDRFIIEILREDHCWTAFRLADGKKTPERNFVIPQDLDASDLVIFLDDMFHEFARPGTSIKKLD